MEWALEKAKELWQEREQVMKERLSRAVAAGSGGKAAGEMNADKTAVREAMEKRQKRGLPDETEDAETAAQRLTRKLSGEDSGQRFKAEETEGRAAPVGMTVRDTASPQMRIADNGERAAAWLWQELGKSVKSGAAAAAQFSAQMRRGSELFAGLERLDFVKCDIEGYEVVVLTELRPLLERFRPTVLVETGGGNRPRIVELFTALGYKAFTLERGREIPLTAASTKDIIFRPQ